MVASAFESDGRFKVVTSPYQRVRPGKTARFVSGSQVSVLGAIVTNQNCSTQQSFERIESGTILEISPVVRDDSVDVDLFQQVSPFVRTDSSSQPTLNKRELRTSLSVKDGEVALLPAWAIRRRTIRSPASGSSRLRFRRARAVADHSLSWCWS